MPNWFEKVTDFAADADALSRRRYGVIDVQAGCPPCVHLRPFPKLVTLPEVALWGERHHTRTAADRCRLYYNQPRRFPNFLALKYMLSGSGTSLTTIFQALELLDEIARLKRTDAILGDVANFRISRRMLERFGWAAHKPSRWHRHYIKRFYGVYPERRVAKEAVADCQLA